MAERLESSDRAQPIPGQRAAEVQRGTARAAVLGISDGLVTNVALILGVAAAEASPPVVRLAGLASLVAGACSMAVGEYVSMRAQVELLEGLLIEEARRLRENPEGARADLEQFILRAGVSRRTARQASREMARDPACALATYARSIGLNPDELGSPWAAAFSSLLTFAFGALVPLLPWFFGAGRSAQLASVALAGVASIGIGVVLARLSGRSWPWPAFRQLLVIAIAAGATVLVGRLFHVPVG
ncbi:MAG TPA: VIT1/CCC1 transporter family protein [Myxococcales bacterium]|nr:VIT1/CCC1 transporter family protein [Myxococcales bacterium]